MDRQEIINELTVSIGDCIKARGLSLVDIIFRQEGRDLVLKVLVDRPEGGISVGECAGVNNAISSILEEKDTLRERYVLEVSSPGLDRPLKTTADFSRCINKKVKFFFSEPVGEKWELDGIIKEAKDDSVVVEAQSGIIEIPLVKITKAKQILE